MYNVALVKACFLRQQKFEAEPHPNKFVFVVENVSFEACFSHLKGVVREPSFWTQYMYRFES